MSLPCSRAGRVPAPFCWPRARDSLRATRALCRHVLSVPKAGSHLGSEFLPPEGAWMFVCSVCVFVGFVYAHHGLECVCVFWELKWLSVCKN